MSLNIFFNLSSQKPNSENSILFGRQYEISNESYIDFCRAMAENEDFSSYESISNEPETIETIPVIKPLTTRLRPCNDNKPQESYGFMIYKALESSPDGKLTLSEIYKWIESNYPYYKTADPVWKNSIRHNLSLNSIFKKIARPENTKGKGGYWSIDRESQKEGKINKKRRNAKAQPHSSMNDSIFKENTGKLIF